MKDSTINTIIEVANAVAFLCLFYFCYGYCHSGNIWWLVLAWSSADSLFRHGPECSF